MHILNSKLHINFMGKRQIALIGSALLLIGSIASLAINGLNFGIDFTGGTLIEVQYEQPTDPDAVRKQLADAGFANALVTTIGSARDLSIRIPPADGDSEQAASKKAQAELSNKILQTLKADGTTVESRKVDFVGPSVGEELREEGGLALLVALGGILIYVAMRFEYRFALGSVAALAHDVLIVLGTFSLLQHNFDLAVLAALLAVIGYSLNDTIVVFDRIRENFRFIRKGSPEEIMNTSINQTLSRTLMTSITTLLVLLALYFLGGPAVHEFAFALIIGVVIGTYSSIYIASASALALGVSKADLMPTPKEELLDDRP